MPVTRHPPHRSVRALLTYTAPTLDGGVKPLLWVPMQNVWGRQPSLHQLFPAFPRQPSLLTATLQLMAPAMEPRRTPSDSRSCTGSSSGSSRNPQLSARRPLPLPGSLSLVCTTPRPPTWKYRTALPHSSAPPIAGWLIEFSSITQPLRSIPFPGLHHYYRLFRPWALLPYSRPRGSSTCGFSVRIGVPGFHVPLYRP
jgi:hypothetical protein